MNKFAIGRGLRPQAAATLLGVARATILRWAKDRTDFPRPRRLSARCTIFDEGELIAWRDAQGAGK
jgi:prophage regulatory protein